MRSHVVLLAALIFSCSAVFAQVHQSTPAGGDKDQQKTYLYQWIDDKGVAHVTDNFGNVPLKYRKKAIMLEQRAAEEESMPQVTVPQPPAAAPVNEEYAKEEWQQRIKDARQRLTEARQRYQELDRKRTEALGKWGGVASGRLEGRMEAERIEQQMTQAQKEVQDAQNQLEVVIPEEARKAGVPPGWLRE
jgi:uncharacterized protein YukE